MAANQFPFHVARGALPSSEQGLDGHARIHKLRNGKLVAIFKLETSHGPFVLSAELSSVKAKAVAKAIAPGSVSGGLPHQGPWPYGSGDLSSTGDTYGDDMATLRANAFQLAGGEPWPYGTGDLSAGAGEGVMAIAQALRARRERGRGGLSWEGSKIGPGLASVEAPSGLHLRQIQSGAVIDLMPDKTMVQVIEVAHPNAVVRYHGKIGVADLRWLRPQAMLPQPEGPGITPSGRRISGADDARPAPWGDAERVYAKLMERDPRAWALLRDLAARSQQGDANALRAWGAICAAHKRANAGDFTRATPAERSAADRVYLRMRRGDPAAVQMVQKIVELSQQGDEGAIKAHKLLCLLHDDAKAAAVMGLSVQFHPDRVRDLLELITRARYASPPPGLLRQAIPYLPEEPPPGGAPPEGRLGKMAQVLAEKEAAAARPSIITATGPTRTLTALPAYTSTAVRSYALRR